METSVTTVHVVVVMVVMVVVVVHMIEANVKGASIIVMTGK